MQPLTCPGMCIDHDVVSHCQKKKSHRGEHRASSIKPPRFYNWTKPLIKIIE